MTDEELKQLVASNAQAIQELSRGMRALSRDVSRLVETQQEAFAQQQEAARERQELRQLIEGNARAIQAFADSAAADREDFREAILRLSGVQEGIANLLASLDDDRPTIGRKLSAIESKVDKILERGEGDRQNSDQ